MEVREKNNYSNNDYLYLSQISERNQAGNLLRLLISTSAVYDLKELFKVVITELKDILEFDIAELLLVESAASKSNCLAFVSGKVSDLQYNDAGLLTGQLRNTGQLHRSHWIKILPQNSVPFARETAYEYSWHMPFVQEGRLKGILQFRTNRKGGFSGHNSAVLHICQMILTPKFLDVFERMMGVEKEIRMMEAAAPDGGENRSAPGELVGKSDGMRKVLSLVSDVAATSSSVLILGETGTGKELVARALHDTSSRKSSPMIKINCAALPFNIIESELFGHERGSFTGAVERRIGKFELANNGTLFLDEIGELHPDMQVKLLRALQEREIERIGGKCMIKVNVRIIAATNRDLLTEVRKGNFRSDLYFRLNVFPITLPPLRERKEDIPLLAMHFLAKHARTNRKPVTGFSARAMKNLKAYDWPGNIRELEHLIERTVLTANGHIIRDLPAPLTVTEEEEMPVTALKIKTIDDVEREHIIKILKKCNGKVAGVGGAAEALRIPSSTLNSKMRKLNIKRGYIERT